MAWRGWNNAKREVNQGGEHECGWRGCEGKVGPLEEGWVSRFRAKFGPREKWFCSWDCWQEFEWEWLEARANEKGK